MNKDAYRYRFNQELPLQEVEDSLLLAVLAVENLYGRSLVRLDAAFLLDRQERTCELEAGTEVGRAIARIFTGFLSQQFGEQSFRIERVGGVPAVGGP